MMTYLNMEETLFRDRSAFEIDFVPSILNFREAQIKDIIFATRPGIHGNGPLYLVLRGLPSTGKTTAVHWIFSDIRTSTQQLIPVYTNCHAGLSGFTVITRIYAALYNHPPLHKTIRSGHMISDIGKALTKRKAVLLVCFDDADNLLPGYDLADILNPLLRIAKKYPKASLMFLLLVCNMEVDMKLALDSCLVSALQPAEVYFPPYKDEEIREIFHDRIRVGLHPGVISGNMISIITGQVIRSGDIREGLYLVKRSVMTAELDGRSSVSSEDLRSSFEISRTNGPYWRGYVN